MACWGRCHLVGHTPLVCLAGILTPRKPRTGISCLSVLSLRLLRTLTRAFGAALTEDDVLLDLYCGTGTIGLSLARRCRAVFGYEVERRTKTPDCNLDRTVDSLL
jgi:hypothetical protein